MTQYPLRYWTLPKIILLDVSHQVIGCKFPEDWTRHLLFPVISLALRRVLSIQLALNKDTFGWVTCCLSNSLKDVLMLRMGSGFYVRTLYCFEGHRSWNNLSICTLQSICNFLKKLQGKDRIICIKHFCCFLSPY